MIDYDVVIVGAGPGGATAAALLAAHGHRVLALERSTSSDVRVGESLLPLCAEGFRRIGVPADAPCLLPKRGAMFHELGSEHRRGFAFAEGRPGASAWQAARPQLDAYLRARAVMAGAEVVVGTAVTGVQATAADVVVDTSAGAVRSRYVLDASGPKAMLGRRARAIVPHRGFGRAAVWAHYDGLSAEVAAELAETGDIHVVFLDEAERSGWGWLIPLPERRLSVGVVSRTTIDAGHLARTIGRLPWLRRITSGLSPSPPRLVGDFSYTNAAPFGARVGCIGDAAGFLDPVFSTGVSLAVAHAVRVCDALHEALCAGREHDATLMDGVAAWMRTGYDRFSAVVRRFYDSRLIHNLVFHENPRADLRRGLVAMLGGFVWDDDNPFYRTVIVRDLSIAR